MSANRLASRRAVVLVNGGIAMLKQLGLAAALAFGVGTPAAAQVTLYTQNFENPTGFVNDGGDINIFRTVNQLYGGQPAGFTFAQPFTTETLLIGGNQAFGTGYLDPTGIGGRYAIGFLSDVQNDLLGLAFNVGAYQFLNLGATISSIDLDRFGGPFVPTGGAVPIFRFSLFDNPSGATGLGSGTALDSFDVTGLLNPAKNTFLWSNATGGLNAAGSTNGNVILRIDLLQGGYAAIDNLQIVASDIRGDLGVPEPATWGMLIAGFAGIGAALRRRPARRLAQA